MWVGLRLGKPKLSPHFGSNLQDFQVVRAWIMAVSTRLLSVLSMWRLSLDTFWSNERDEEVGIMKISSWSKKKGQKEKGKKKHWST